MKVTDPEYGASLEEIGEHFGKTKEWARLEVSKALHKLKESGQLDEFRDILYRRSKEVTP